MSKKIPSLLAISDGLRLADSTEALTWLDRLARAGIDGVQLREKSLDDVELFELARRLRAHLPVRVAVLVNGRLDVAIAAGCDGVHLPADGAPLTHLRRRFGPEPLIGRSTHAPEEVETARDEGADYVTFGPVFPTPSKTAYGPPPGLEGLRRATGYGLPVLALGGIEPANLPAVAAAGAAGVAGIRCFQDPETLARVAEAGRRLWPREGG